MICDEGKEKSIPNDRMITPMNCIFQKDMCGGVSENNRQPTKKASEESIVRPTAVILPINTGTKAQAISPQTKNGKNFKPASKGPSPATLRYTWYK